MWFLSRALDSTQAYPMISQRYGDFVEAMWRIGGGTVMTSECVRCALVERGRDLPALSASFSAVFEQMPLNWMRFDSSGCYQIGI